MDNNEHLNTPARDESAGTSRSFPVIEEQINIDKKFVDNGKVKISKRVSTENLNITIPVVTEQISVERKPINKYIETPPPAIRQEGDKTIVSVVKEDYVVVKRILLVEELHVTKKRTEKNVLQPVSVRKEEVIVERTNEEGTER